jgi:hypothetical protein
LCRALLFTPPTHTPIINAKVDFLWRVWSKFETEVLLSKHNQDESEDELIKNDK